MYSYELHQVTVKKSPENAESAFYEAFYAEKWPKYREIPLFLQKSRYLKNTFFDTSLARKVLLSSNLDQLLLGAWEKRFFDHSHFSA